MKCFDKLKDTDESEHINDSDFRVLFVSKGNPFFTFIVHIYINHSALRAHL